jgi:hypothetical protein
MAANPVGKPKIPGFQGLPSADFRDSAVPESHDAARILVRHQNVATGGVIDHPAGSGVGGRTTGEALPGGELAGFRVPIEARKAIRQRAGDCDLETIGRNGNLVPAIVIRRQVIASQALEEIQAAGFRLMEKARRGFLAG